MKKKIFGSYYSLVILLWTILITIFWGQIYDEVDFVAAVVFVSSLSLPLVLGVSILTSRMLPNAIANKQMRRYVLHFLLITLLMSLIYDATCLFFRYLESVGCFPDSPLFDDIGPFWREMLASLFTIVLIATAFTGLRMYYEHSKLQKVHFDSHLQMLQAQVNPHFMFNVLNHIHILIRKDVDLASFLLEKYSEILRYQLYSSKKETVPLSQEIQFVKDVVSIERLRWGDDLTVDCTWQIEDGTRPVEPLLLIAFVENAFKHVSRSMSDKGYINLVIRQSDKTLYMEIENSKSKYTDKKSVENSSGLGLKNIKERLQILYPSRHVLDIEETDWVYKTRLTITLH